MARRLLHDSLWRRNLDLAHACLDHPFVRGLRDGDLDPERFKGYVAQDAFFLRAFLSAYALAAARHTERLDRAATFHRLMGGVLEELKLHTGYARSLGIDLQAVEPRPATSAYTDFLLRTAWTGGLDEIVAAMTPCLRLYAFLGRRLAPPAAANPYREWIETYSSPEFERLASDLEGLLDSAAADRPRVADAYRYAMTCERDFFASAYAPRT